MGIFDIFKTKVGQAGEKVGDVAEQAKDKVSDLMDKNRDEESRNPVADDPFAEAGGAVTDEEADMVSEGAPVMGEAEAPDESSAGMTQSIKDNVASGVDKAGEKAKGATGNKHDDKIDDGVRKAKDMLG